MYQDYSAVRRFTAVIAAVTIALWNPAPHGVLKAQNSPEAAAPRPAGYSPAAGARTDSFETKLKLLEAAWQNGDFDLARSLTHSLHDSVRQTQQEQQNPGPSLVKTSQWREVGSLSESWQQWADGWQYCKALSVRETAGESRVSEPVEITLSVPHSQATSLAREIRLARIDNDRLVEVPCQILGEVRRGDERFCQILWMMDRQPGQLQNFLVFYGNPYAELPDYPSDLTTSGEGFGLDISNAHFTVSLSRQTGQIERMTLRREHGLELFSGGEGHGEPPGIDWAHDYVDADNFQKLRISLWDKCPDYEVIRGPLCTIVRRWGFPHSPVHPIYTPAKLNVDVEYRFYSGLPWFHKIGKMRAIQTFEASALRDDEWVFSGYSFTDKLWMDRDGTLHSGDVDDAHRDDLWGVGFFNRDSQDSFMALFLEHRADGLPELRHSGSPTLVYKWHGPLWSRYPLPGRHVPAGAVLHQKNAYVAIPFTEEAGKQTIETMRRCMMNPLQLTATAAADIPTGPATGSAATSERLARPGEAGDATRLKQQVWDALQDCKDAQLYTADINVVDLGLVYDVRVRGDVVTVLMTMPHRGRPRLGYFIDGSISVHPTPSVPVRERLMQIPGVRQAVVRQTWEPAWNTNFLTDPGRRKLGLE